ncbi:hypothetical protein K280104A7_33170 [Candidatus Bariatricus faecipullorum]
MKKRLTNLLVIPLIIFLFGGNVVRAESTDYVYKQLAEKTLQVTYSYTTNATGKEEGEFEDTLEYDGKTWKLEGITYEELEKIPVKTEKQVSTTVLSGPAASPESADFEPEIVRDGVIYQLDESSIISTGETRIQEVTSRETYESENDIPQERTVTSRNVLTGQDENVLCTLENVSEGGDRWEDSYIDITVHEYNADTFEWNGYTLGRDAVENLLYGYEQQILSSVGLSTADARIEGIYWTTDEYAENGTVYRDARADIQVLRNTYIAEYSGQIETRLYQADYTGVETEETGDFNYEMNATAVYSLQESNTALYVAIGLGMAVIILLIILILYTLSKKEKEKTSSELK